jgi:DNA-binding transcriptional regulator YiaG
MAVKWTKETTGKRVAAIMRRGGFSEYTLADRLGVNWQSVRNWLLGGVVPMRAHQEKLEALEASE